MPKYEVPIVYRGQVNYVVEADNVKQAQDLAEQRFNDGDNGDTLGTEWETIERVGAITKIA